MTYSEFYDIIKWCRANIKNTDVFMYLGDLAYMKANDLDKAKTQAIFRSLPGVKILLLGNHDVMGDDPDFWQNCGFKYIIEELEWKNIIFSHMPLPVSGNTLNIHGHIHSELNYYDPYASSTDPNALPAVDGKHNINVYPGFYGNRPVTLKYLLDHSKEIIQRNYNRAPEAVI